MGSFPKQGDHKREWTVTNLIETDEPIDKQHVYYDLTRAYHEKLRAAGFFLTHIIAGVSFSPLYPKKLGGGYYELSDGTKVRTKKAAILAQSKITEI